MLLAVARYRPNKVRNAMVAVGKPIGLSGFPILKTRRWCIDAAKDTVRDASVGNIHCGDGDERGVFRVRFDLRRGVRGQNNAT